VHLVAGPASLVLGAILLMSDRLRRTAPTWHRRLGRVQGVVVLLLVAPSGLWMAFYAEGGPIAGLGLGLLAVLTAGCMALGVRAAVLRHFADHRRWMSRAFILLCSAVAIRIIGGLATVAAFDRPWLYPLSIWMSWLVPLLAFEAIRLLNQRVGPVVATN
jgi:uncharacterized membrane protein